MKKILLLDGNGLIFRAYFATATRMSVSSNGTPTNALYLFASIIMRLIEKKDFDDILVALDSPGKKFRHKEFNDYKANRKEVPMELKLQFAPIKEFLNICNIKTIEIEGYEADDIIGTLICQSDEDWDFYFRDNDILQNIGTYNLCVSFENDLTLGKIVDVREHMRHKYELDLDYLPLLWKVIKGDSGDCIPIGFERFPTKILKGLCLDERFHSNNVTFDDCIDVLLEYKNYTGKTKESIEKLKDKNSDLYKKLEINYKLVKPMYLEKIKRRKMIGDTKPIFSKFNIKNI